ncbi:MAG: cyclic 2,3-diphosphoglycerate synthetase [Actinomycetota bacterium]|nr:cyclic 2,3-diphosphoglycerate synthetase [Actinomycetota bacterium]
MRTIVLIDGEHHPPVTRWGIDVARARGHEVVGAVFLGGEKGEAYAPDVGVPVWTAGEDPMATLARAIVEATPGVVLDLSDEPVLGYRERMELVAVALVHRVPYVGSDFRFDPPAQSPPIPEPTLAVIGTGKRAGKTAIAGALARLADRRGLRPIVVAMGRGGPAEPQIAEAGSVDLAHLLDLVGRGEHAASDYLENAVTTGVTTVGARRVGAGLAGAPYATDVADAASLASGRGAGLVILDGSGASLPPVPWDAGVLVIPATTPPEYVGGYLGPYRLLRSNLVVVTMAADPTGSENLSALRSHIRRFLGDAPYVATEFIPEPLADVRDRRVFFATTAPRAVAARQIDHLESAHGCRIVGWSARLADRAGLAEDLDATQEYDVFLSELKAAAVDIGVTRALARGAEVVFVDNRAVAVEGSADLETAFGEVIDRSLERSTR